MTFFLLSCCSFAILHFNLSHSSLLAKKLEVFQRLKINTCRAHYLLSLSRLAACFMYKYKLLRTSTCPVCRCVLHYLFSNYLPASFEYKLFCVYNFFFCKVIVVSSLLSFDVVGYLFHFILCCRMFSIECHCGRSMIPSIVN